MEELYLSEEDQIFFDEKLNVIDNDRQFSYALFHTSTNIFPMAKYEEDLSSINDYIYYCNINLDNILKEKIKDLENIKVMDKSYEWYYKGDIMIHESNVYTIQSMIKITNKSSHIILLLSFLEGALKEIAEWYIDIEGTHYMRTTRKREDSKIDYYIKQISQCCEYDLPSILENEMKIINRAKKIRNIVVHEWDTYFNDNHRDTLKSTLENFKITELINTVSVILDECEYAGYKSNLLK